MNSFILKLLLLLSLFEMNRFLMEYFFFFFFFRIYDIFFNGIVFFFNRNEVSFFF